MFEIILLLCLCNSFAIGNEALKEMEDVDQKQDDSIKRLTDILEMQSTKMESFEASLQKQSEEIIALKGKQHQPIPYYDFNYGCVGYEIPLSCDNNKQILVITAKYGYYSVLGCEEGQCCAPHGSDCTELVSENDNSEWLSLKLLCDEQTNCIYTFRSAIFTGECSGATLVEYMTIDYKCLPDDANEPISFTAYATASRFYDTRETIIFDGILSNFGSHYHTNINAFICPMDGVYAFSVNILSYDNMRASAQIIVDSKVLSQAYAYSVPDNFRQSASAFVIHECLQGQRVWAQTHNDDHGFYGGQDGLSTFSGFFLHALVSADGKQEL